MITRQARIWALAISLTFALHLDAQSDNADKSPHKSAFITVNQVKLHYLDWGGAGETLLLLHGMNGTPHFYDTLAPKCTNQFRVLGLTRRGHGESEMPATGYDPATLVADVRQFLQALKIQRVVLAGHSFAGDEVTRFAVTYPAASSKSFILTRPTTTREFPQLSVGNLCMAVCRKVCPPKTKANHRTVDADG